MKFATQISPLLNFKCFNFSAQTLHLILSFLFFTVVEQAQAGFPKNTVEHKYDW
jgi:hypothetical protein